MNERIKQLLSQAGVHYEVMPKDTVYEKFAELIVQECAKVAVHKPNGLWYTGTDAGLVSAGRMTAAQLIKEHFGVE